MKCKACFNIRILATFLCKFKELHYKNMSKQERVCVNAVRSTFITKMCQQKDFIIRQFFCYQKVPFKKLDFNKLKIKMAK